MIELTQSRELTSSPQEIWAVLSDFAAISRWASNVDHACLMSEQTSGRGMVRRIQSSRNVVIETVTTWQPEKTLAYTIEGLPPVIKSLTNTWTLKKITQGTKVTLITRIDAGPRPPQILIAKAVGKKMSQAAEQMLSGLVAETNIEAPKEEHHG